ncbi:metal ABC transporter solute-binding protein, Zn/Mn family [Pseudonocardia spirodelae]|uniref:Zinc ABC transporter substrate-binding protein n=1 Tax=Pseudonocardia spirodelae TaxID=3133431 RepID=A0ABU8T6E6_9PSEU
MSRSPLRPAALVAGLAALALGATACGSGQVDAPTSADTPQVKIVASTDAWGAVARAVGGNYAQVTSVIDSPDVDPHGYEPTPQNAATVGGAQLVLMNGGGYDAFMTDLVAASGSRAPVVDAVEVSGIEGATEAAADDHAHDHAAEASGEAGHEHEGEHAHGSFNEHVWYDPDTVTTVAQQLADQLGRIDPGAAEYFRTNAATLAGGAAQLKSKATEIGRAHPGATVAVTEPVPDYLLDAAGLKNATPQEFSAAVEEGTDPPAAVVAQMLGLFTANPPVGALVLNSQTTSPTTDQVRSAAQQAGVPVVEMSETLPQGTTDWVQWMNANLDELAGALNR